MKTINNVTLLLLIACGVSCRHAEPARDGDRKELVATPEDDWNKPHAPFTLYGNTHYVGVTGLSSVLITSSQGHVLIDGGLPESAALIAASIQQLGFRLEDVKYIANSHAHFDHAGGIAELQKLTGATVIGSELSVRDMRSGKAGADDPQYKSAPDYTPVAQVQVIHNGDVLQVGDVQVKAHYTPGHTPGGVTWAWRSCEANACKDMVFADSIWAVSNERFRFTGSSTLAALDASIATIATLPCDILISAHPDFSNLWQRFAMSESQGREAFIDRDACARYARAGRDFLNRRLYEESLKD